MNKIIISLLCILILSSCSEEKKMTDFDIICFDNYYVYHAPNLRIIDSLINEHPREDYPHGLKIIYLSEYINVDSAFNYGYGLKNVERGTFCNTGFILAVTKYQRQFGKKSMTLGHRFETPFYLDRRKINIWSRIGIANEYFLMDSLSLAYKYYIEALDINPDNAYIKELLVRLALKRKDTSDAKYYLEQIPKDYKPKRIKKYKEQLKQMKETSENE